jgi:DNA integrity scanning protein DisA with diadenylate cyclase activity/mannitol/fructose-specific phosphotransferase system IIA component (Ntr-type)
VTFSRYIKVPTLIDLHSSEKTDALKELATSLCKALDIRKVKAVIDDVLKREESASTFMGHGLAIPQARAQIKDDFAIAVGRSIDGVDYDAARKAKALILVLVIAKESETVNTIELLAQIDSFFRNEAVQKRILSSDTPINIRALAATSRTVRDTDRIRRVGKKAANPVINAALGLVRELKASTLLVFADAVTDTAFLEPIKKTRAKLIVATSAKSQFSLKDKRIAAIIHAPAFPASRTGQIKIGVLLALSRNLIQKSDTVVCLSGDSRTGVFDTVVALDVAAEYRFFLSAAPTILPADVKPEVLERLLALAGEIAVEGREGKPTGTIFVVGDTNTVNGFVRQLIINPFRGYSEAERNILDPGLGETIKELAAIDGAFIITGDGIVLSAGSYLRPESGAEIEPLPSGFGTRHAAAAGITACTDALAITVSESTGMVTMFKRGTIIMTISKPIETQKGLVQRAGWEEQQQR